MCYHVSTVDMVAHIHIPNYNIFSQCCYMLLAQGPNAYFSITSFGWTNFCTNLATCCADSPACRHFWREIAIQAQSDPGTMSRAVFVMAHTSHGATLSTLPLPLIFCIHTFYILYCFPHLYMCFITPFSCSCLSIQACEECVEFSDYIFPLSFL